MLLLLAMCMFLAIKSTAGVIPHEFIECKKVVVAKYGNRFGDKVDFWGAFVSSYTLIVVDKQPQSNDPDKYDWFYLKKTNNEWTITTTYLGMYYPERDMILFDSYSYHNNPSPNLIGDADAKPSLINPVETNNEHTYAIIINGGNNKFVNYYRYYNDCKYIYNVLRDYYSIPRNNIVLCIADGDNPADDIRYAGTSLMCSTPIYWEDDNVQDLFHPATRQGIESAFNELKSKMTSLDNLLVFVTGHGGRDTVDEYSFIPLWGGEEFKGADLATMLKSIKKNFVYAVLGQCYSGGMIADLKSVCMSIATACDTEETSNFKQVDDPEKEYDEFLRHWSFAFKRNREGKLNGDANSDGYVCMREAFNYAQNNNSFYLEGEEHPQYYQASPFADLMFGLYQLQHGIIWPDSDIDSTFDNTLLSISPDHNFAEITFEEDTELNNKVLRVNGAFSGKSLPVINLNDSERHYQIPLTSLTDSQLIISVISETGSLVYQTKTIK